MLYAKTPEIKRVGSFFDPSGIFKDFPGCGRNGQGQHAGVIHQQVITCNVGLPISRSRSLTTRPVANLWITGILHRLILHPAKVRRRRHHIGRS